MQVQQEGVQIAGQNLANVNNPAYSRQRLVVQNSSAVDTALGPEGTGVEAVQIQQLRDLGLDSEIRDQNSVTGFLQAQQNALQGAEDSLGAHIDTQATGVSGATGVLTGSTLAGDLAGFFNAFQTLSTDPSQRQGVIDSAKSLAGDFKQVDASLTKVRSAADAAEVSDVSKANKLLSSIASLNDQITRSEARTGGPANDLRDTRQQALSDLAKLVKADVAEGSDGTLNLSIGGTLMVTGSKTLDTLQTYDAGGGQMLVRAASSGTPIASPGGSVQGSIDVRDGTLATLQSDLNRLAGRLISAVNTVHASGFNPAGGTGAAFFTGSGSADMAVNPSLVNDPSLIQASGMAGKAGNNTVALALADLRNQADPALGNLTPTAEYGRIVGGLGQSISDTNTQAASAQLWATTLDTQRQSVSGVSLDEEMADLVKYQKAFQASARLVTTISDMMDQVLNMKQ